MKLGKKLRELRQSKKLHQIDLANMLNIDRTTYGKYETGDSSPDYNKIIKLANYFNVSVDYLLGVKPNQSSENDEENIIHDPQIRAIARASRRLSTEKKDLLHKLAESMIEEAKKDAEKNEEEKE